MSVAQWLLLLVPLAPLACALASVGWRQRAWLLPLAPLPALACAIGVAPGSTLALPDALLGAILAQDALGAVFLGFCALLWTAGGAYALAYLGDKPHARGFCVCWHLTAAGSLAVCVAADAASFYAAFAALSLAAYVLVVHDRSAAALRAGRIYLVLAVGGEIALLSGLLLALQGAESARIADIRAALPQAPWRDAAVACLLAGFGLKAGLVPLHGWLPLAHSAAPVPASAVLSGAIVKAGILGLLRFLPAGLPDWPAIIALAGLLTAYAGVLLGLAQAQPKAVLAYSTMSQMGLLVAVLGAGLASPQLAQMHAAVAFYALHHGLAKGGLFLAAGLLALGWGRRGVLAAAALLGGAIAGLPFTGGALAKLATKGPLGEGWTATLAGLSAIGTMLLMLRFLFLARRTQPAAQSGVPVLLPLAFGLLVLATLLLPWLLFPRLVGSPLAYAWSPAAVWAAAWPIALALAIGLAVARRPVRHPHVPVGDIASWADDAVRGLRWPALPAAAQAPQRLARAWGTRVVAGCSAAAQRLTHWPVAATVLLVLLALLALTLHRP